MAATSALAGGLGGWAEGRTTMFTADLGQAAAAAHRPWLLHNRPHVHGCMSQVSGTHKGTLALLPRRPGQLIHTAHTIHSCQTSVYARFCQAVAMVIFESTDVIDGTKSVFPSLKQHRNKYDGNIK